MRPSVLTAFFVFANLVTAQGDPSSRGAGPVAGEATAFAYNGSDVNLDRLTASPVVLGGARSRCHPLSP